MDHKIKDLIAKNLHALSCESASNFSQSDSCRRSKNNKKKSAKSGIHPQSSNLTSTDFYRRIILQVDHCLSRACCREKPNNNLIDEKLDDTTDKLIADCCRLTAEIDQEIFQIHYSIRTLYRSRFPELESLIQQPIEYARVVQAIGRAKEIEDIDLNKFLPSTTVMMVTLTAASTLGKPLSHNLTRKIMQGCSSIIQLDADRKSILSLIEEKMNLIAPNLSGLLGTVVAADLASLVGGLSNLSKIPSCNIQNLGSKKKHASGYKHFVIPNEYGIVYRSDIIQQTPAPWKMKALKLISAKCALLSRIDAHNQDPTGNEGLKKREEILAAIEKWEELPVSIIKKALPIPDCAKNKRRGGRRKENFKKRFGMSKYYRAMNRLAFNQPDEETMNENEQLDISFGHNFKKNSRSNNKHHSSKPLSTKFCHPVSNNGLNGYSSLIFAPVQGFDLSNPFTNTSIDKRDGKESYFSETSVF
jgi:U4/U6 small nuclear ribonucleoprotein PRP31